MLTTDSDLTEAVGTVSDPRPQEAYDEQAIAALAYELWQARGCPEGSPQEDWFHAIELLSSQNRGEQTTSAVAS